MSWFRLNHAHSSSSNYDGGWIARESYVNINWNKNIQVSKRDGHIKHKLRSYLSFHLKSQYRILCYFMESSALTGSLHQQNHKDATNVFLRVVFLYSCLDKYPETSKTFTLDKFISIIKYTFSVDKIYSWMVDLSAAVFLWGGKKALGSNPGQDLSMRSFACSPCICVGFLWGLRFPPCTF